MNTKFIEPSICLYDMHISIKTKRAHIPALRGFVVDFSAVLDRIQRRDGGRVILHRNKSRIKVTKPGVIPPPISKK